MVHAIIGLGNPGEDYEHSRHNVGRDAVRALAADTFPTWKRDAASRALMTSGELCGQKVELVLPEAFMNRSGGSVERYRKHPERLIVIHDDIDLPAGHLRIVFGRGSGGHKGVESVIRTLGTNAFARIRVGVSPRVREGIAKKPKGEALVEKFLLTPVRGAARTALAHASSRAAEAARLIIEKGVERAMNDVNARKR